MSLAAEHKPVCMCVCVYRSTPGEVCEILGKRVRRKRKMFMESDDEEDDNQEEEEVFEMHICPSFQKFMNAL